MTNPKIISRAQINVTMPAVLKRTALWAVDLLDDGDGVLIADETGDAKSSTDAVAAAYQYSGSVGGVDLCQVAVHLTFATTEPSPT